MKTKKPSVLENLKRENQTLKNIVIDYHWMARRYADGRSSYATSLFNGHVKTLLNLGISLNPTYDGTIWARDSGGRPYDGLTEEQAALGQPPDWTSNGIERKNEELTALVHSLQKQVRELEDSLPVLTEEHNAHE